MDTEKKRALLIGVYNGASDKEVCIEHLDELVLLTETFGAEIVDSIACPLRRFDAATFLGKGKVEELVGVAKSKNIDMVIIDQEISPAQQRNLEKIFKISVLDRTEIIIEVFAQRAHSKEARLQIELAKTRYEAPRLKRLWTHLSRQAGGGTHLKGEGEKQIEIDKRLIKKRIDKLKKEIEEVQSHRETQRIARRRSEIPVFAIVGYTNAGKSTLLNALTDAGVFVEDKLFATLDTTTRKFTLPNNQEILLVDTVGFVRKLPHQLIVAFRSTLEEAFQADILLHLIDASHHNALEQAEAAQEVIKELGAEDRPMITVLNKIDQCSDDENLTKLCLKYPRTIQISALKHEGFDDLQKVMIEELSKSRRLVKLRIPQSDYHLVSTVIREGRVISQDYEGNDVVIQADLPMLLVSRLESYVENET